MTYKTRQEVLRVAADWMDICEKAGVEAKCMRERRIVSCDTEAFYSHFNYEFPLALLEGKEVWVGSELYDDIGNKHIAPKTSLGEQMTFGESCKWSWNPPKPATVMVEMLIADAEWLATFAEKDSPASSAGKSSKKALENLK